MASRGRRKYRRQRPPADRGWTPDQVADFLEGAIARNGGVYWTNIGEDGELLDELVEVREDPVEAAIAAVVEERGAGAGPGEEPG